MVENPEFSKQEVAEARDTLSKLKNTLNKELKSQSLKVFKNVWQSLNEDMVEGYDDVEEAIEEYENIEREGKTPEEYNDEKTSAFEEIISAVDSLELTQKVKEQKFPEEGKMVNPLSLEPEPKGPTKRPYKALPPESERPINPITKKPYSSTEMYAIRQTEKQAADVPILPQERLHELRKRVNDIQAEMPQLEFYVKVLPEDHRYRRQAEMRLTSLRANLAKANAELQKEETEVEQKTVSSELKRTRAMIEQMGRELTERIRATEERVKGTPAEIEEAVKESKAIMQRLTEIEERFDKAMSKVTAAPAVVTEEEEPRIETPPEEFSVTPKFSPLTGRLTGFVVADPDGHTATKLERYYETILHEYTREVDPTTLQNADVNYTEYRVTIVLPQKQETPKQWWTVPTAGGEVSISEYFQPSATDISRFWKIYHSTDVHADKGFLQMKADMTDYAKRRGWSPKPARAANLDRYLYAYYQAQAPSLKDWFFRTIYEVPG